MIAIAEADAVRATNCIPAAVYSGRLAVWGTCTILGGDAWARESGQKYTLGVVTVAM